MTVRFPAQLPYAASEPCLEVFAAIVAGDWALAKARYDANPRATSDTMGALRWWREKFVPIAPAIIPMPWGQPFKLPIPYFVDQVLAFEFDIPAGPPLAVGGYCTVYEYQGEPYLRQVTLSRTPGDFRPVDPSGANGPFDAGAGVQASVYWNRGNPPLALAPGRYYFNARNDSTPPESRPAAVETLWPK
jgi:hypothetical protein